MKQVCLNPAWLLLCLTLMSGVGRAADAPAEPISTETLTEQQAVALALRQDAVALSESALRTSARAALDQARLLPNPMLRWERENGRGDIDGSRETAWTLSQTLDLGGSRGLNARAAVLGIDRAEAAVRAARWRSRLEVLTRFHATAAAESLLSASTQRADALASLAQQAGLRQRAGDLAGFEARRLALSAGEARIVSSQRKADVAAAREALAALIGEQGLHAGLAPEPLSSESYQRLLASNDLERHPELKVLRDQLDAAEAAAVAARRWRVPVEFGLGQRRIEVPGSSDNALMLELAVPLPLFDRNQVDAARRQGELDQARAEWLLAERQLAAERAVLVAEARQRVDSALTYRDQLVPEARALSAVAARSFAEGEIDVVGLLEALAAEASVLQQSAELDLHARLSLIRLSAYAHEEGESP